MSACGYLTVLEDRSAPTGGRSSSSSPEQIHPATRRAWPTLGVGGDIGLGSARASGVGAARTKTTAYNLEMRGTGLSRPRLDCPEVDAVAATVAEAWSRDKVVRIAFLDAVAACRKHLTDQGIDVAAYDVSEAAADIIDLRVALGIEEWGLRQQGHDVRFLLEALRRDRIGS